MELIRSVYKLDLEIREAKADEKYHRVEGQAVPFQSRTQIFGRYYEEFVSGAFERTIKEAEPDAALLIDHRGLAIARQSNKTVVFREDADGLQFDAKLDREDPDVQALVPKLRSGNVRHMSVGFIPRKYAIREEEDDTVTDEMQDVDLYEASFVTFPAYADTEASLRTRSSYRDKKLSARTVPHQESFNDIIRREQEFLRQFRAEHL